MWKAADQAEFFNRCELRKGVTELCFVSFSPHCNTIRAPSQPHLLFLKLTQHLPVQPCTPRCPTRPLSIPWLLLFWPRGPGATRARLALLQHRHLSATQAASSSSPEQTPHPYIFFFPYQRGHKKPTTGVCHWGIKKFQGLWWPALQFMFNMKAAGAVCVNSATVRWLLSPERDSASCIAGNSEN